MWSWLLEPCHMKIQLAAKSAKILMDGYPALVRTDGQTDGRD